MEGERVVYKEKPGEMAEKVLEFIKTGVNVIGGCCGTTPEHLEQIVKSIKEYEGKG